MSTPTNTHQFPTNADGGWIVPAKTSFPEGTVFPAYSEFGHSCKFGSGCEFGLSCKFGHSCKFGEDCTFSVCCKFDPSCQFGHSCKFGENCTFGADCIMEGVKVIKFMQMDNVDGSGRRIQLFLHAKGVLVRAGCFLGSSEEFAKKAESEGKHRYARVVLAVASSLS